MVGLSQLRNLTTGDRLKNVQFEPNTIKPPEQWPVWACFGESTASTCIHYSCILWLNASVKDILYKAVPKQEQRTQRSKCHFHATLLTISIFLLAFLPLCGAIRLTLLLLDLSPFPCCLWPLWPGCVNRWMHPCLLPVSLCLPTMLRQEAGQTAVSLSQYWILSARCEEDMVTSLLWDSLVTKARRRRRGVNLFLDLLIYTPS